MVSLGQNGYVPIGVDIKVDAAQASKRVLAQLGIRGYVVAADLSHLPFKSESFDAVFSYSVLQHVHRSRMLECLEDIHRILKNDGVCMLEFPTKHGIGNSLRFVSRTRPQEDDPLSWCVRYYRLRELRVIFERLFGSFAFHPDCYFGIGVQALDIDILPIRYRPIVYASEWLKKLSVHLHVLQKLADSVFVVSKKKASVSAAGQHQLPERYQGNLGVIPLLSCPVSGCELEFDEKRGELISMKAGLAYPILSEVPVLIPELARKIA